MRHPPCERVQHPDGGGVGPHQSEEVCGGPAVRGLHQGGQKAVSHTLSHVVWHQDGVSRHAGGLPQVQAGESEHLHRAGAAGAAAGGEGAGG